MLREEEGNENCEFLMKVCHPCRESDLLYGEILDRVLLLGDVGIECFRVEDTSRNNSRRIFGLQLQILQ